MDRFGESPSECSAPILTTAALLATHTLEAEFDDCSEFIVVRSRPWLEQATQFAYDYATKGPKPQSLGASTCLP